MSTENVNNKILTREFVIDKSIKVYLINSNIFLKSDKQLRKTHVNTQCIKCDIKPGVITYTCMSDKRSHKAIFYSCCSILQTLINGYNKTFERKLEITYRHFPMKLSIEGQSLIIKNFLGETHQRVAKIIEGVKVAITSKIISVTGDNYTNVTQTAANIEVATKVRNKDRRVFRDGIYMIK